jgi:exodeoxyribonuclease VII large subunit
MNKGLEMPLVPQRIAIISSPTAAGYGDFVDQLLTNRYGFAFFPRLFPAVMQGESTGASIISALEAIETDGSSFDAVVIIRGGGSKLDLSSFDDFDLGMHVAQFNLPVITGIGHEQDDSIIDLVAHTRCKTPTAVAEFIIGRVSEFEARLDESVDSTIGIAEGFLSQARNTLTNIMEGMRLRVKGFTDYRKLELAQLASRTRQSVPVYFRLKGDALTSHEQTSELKNPINLLKMGYSITMVNGKPVKSTAGIRSGDELTTRLADGVVHSTATGSQIDNTKAKS